MAIRVILHGVGVVMKIVFGVLDIKRWMNDQKILSRGWRIVEAVRTEAEKRRGGRGRDEMTMMKILMMDGYF